MQKGNRRSFSGGERGRMEYKFTIYGKLPSLNEFLAAEKCLYHGYSKGNAMKAKYQKIIIQWLRVAGIKHIKSKVFINYKFYEANKKRDKDNISAVAHKFVQDALVVAGVLTNDGWQNIEGFADYFEIDKKNPRIEVTLKALKALKA